MLGIQTSLLLPVFEGACLLLQWENRIDNKGCLIQAAAAAATAAKSLQSCSTLCDPIDGSPPGSLIPGTLQARTLEWVAISFSNAWKWKVKVKSLSHVWPLATPWTAGVGLGPTRLLHPWVSRQEYCSGLPFPSPHSSSNPTHPFLLPHVKLRCPFSYLRSFSPAELWTFSLSLSQETRATLPPLSITAVYPFNLMSCFSYRLLCLYFL